MCSPEQEALLRAYLQGVEQINKHINLTAVDLGVDGYALHIEDSLLAIEEVCEAPAGLLVDMGTGGGFPGVPLAVATGRPTLLVDSTKKKIQAIMELVEKLDIPGIDSYAGRIEELAMQRPETFSVATARALAPLPVLLELASPLLEQGGRLVAYKTPSIESNNELETACSLQELLGMEYVGCRNVYLPAQDIKRSIVVFAKVGQPSIKLPRRVGMAQKRPLQ